MSQMIESFMEQAAEPALRVQLVELEEVPEHPSPGQSVLASGNPLHAVKVRLQVRLGEAEMTVGELLGARENEVLVLDRAVEDPVDLVLEGKVVARGQLLAIADGTFAVRISELPVSLGL